LKIIVRKGRHTLAPDAAPGVYDTDGKTWLRLPHRMAISVTELQLEGKKKMAIVIFSGLPVQ